jgi:hypothetical protein
LVVLAPMQATLVFAQRRWWAARSSTAANEPQRIVGQPRAIAAILAAA